MNASTCASLNQRSNLLLLTCHLHSLCEDAPVEGPEWAVGGGGLFLEQHAWVPHRPLHSRAPSLCLCLCQLPELPLPLQLLMVPLLSSQPISWGQGLQGRVRGSNQDTLGAQFQKHPQTTKNYQFITSNSVWRGPRELFKIFFCLISEVIVNPRYVISCSFCAWKNVPKSSHSVQQ